MNKRLKKFIQSYELERYWGEDTPSGISGSYFHLGFGIGLKVYFECHKTLQEAVGSSDWWQAAHAMHCLKTAQKAGVTPRVYGLTIVKYKKYYHVALAMQHINGHQTGKGMSTKISRAARKLRKLGVYPHDIGTHNAIRKDDGKVYLIDADFWWTNKCTYNRWSG